MAGITGTRTLGTDQRLAPAFNNPNSQHVSNSSSLGGDEFYDAVDDVTNRNLQRVSDMSSAYGSTRSTRTRSSSASNLMPNAEAAELMKLVASTNSSQLDVSAYSTPGEYGVAEGGGGGGGPGVPLLRFDASRGDYRSKNPFINDVTAASEGGAESGQSSSANNVAASATTKRRWTPSGHRQPEKMVVMDISSADNTPVTTPVHGPGGGGVLGSASLLPSPNPPPRVVGASSSSSSRTSSRSASSTSPASLNPFDDTPPRSPKISTKNPFVTASSTINFSMNDDDTQQQGEKAKAGVEDTITRQQQQQQQKEEKGSGGGRATPPPPPPPPVASAAAASSSSSSSLSENRPRKPPPLPPRRALSPSPTQQQPPSAPRSRTTTGEGVGSSGPNSPRSTVSSTTCDNHSQSGRLEGAGAELDAGSVESSIGSDGADGTVVKKNFMVVNKDTGQMFDVRELDHHLPADAYTLLPSRKDLIELERRRLANNAGTTSPASLTPTTPTPTTTSTLAKSPSPIARSGSPSPRSSLSSTMVASVSAAVGSTTSRKEKAKNLGSMMRKRLGKVKTAAAAAASPTTASSRSSLGGVVGGGSGGDTAFAHAEGGSGGGGVGGGGGDRSSGVGMGAAAKAARDALAGIRVSLKGKDKPETLTGLLLFQELRCHDGPIWTASFNQSGQFLATAGQDARILLHRVGDVREYLAGEGDAGGNDGGVAENDSNRGCEASPACAATAAKDARRSSPREDVSIHTEAAAAARGTPPDGADGSVREGEKSSSSAKDGFAPDGHSGGQAATASAASEDSSGGAGTGTGTRPGGGGSGNRSGRGSSRRASATVMIDPTPWQIWEGHKGDVVALSWSRNDFLLSASLDKTVRLWHTTQRSCLHYFQHAETVTSVDFHPLLEHFFLSGCFDKKIRVWNIRDGRVQEWQQAPDMVTAAKFSLDGQMIVAGLYMGQVLFYQTEGMRYFTQIECRNRRGTKKRGCKVSGFAFKRTGTTSGDTSGKDDGGGGGGKDRSGSSSPAVDRPKDPSLPPAYAGPVGRGSVGAGGAIGGAHVPEQLLVTTNDSRLRLYNTDDFGMNAKYKGFTNDTLQITATFSEDGKQIICGSENGKVYVWSTGVFATASPSTLPNVGGGRNTAAGASGIPAVMTAQSAAAAAAALPVVPPTQKDTNQRHESFYATSEAPKIVTTACFVPESTSRACVTAVRGGLSRTVAESGGYCGCMILATDYNGCVRVYCKSAVLLS